MKPFDILVIDEAAQLKESESIIPLLLPGIKQAILVGDELQLPSMVRSNVCNHYQACIIFSITELFLLPNAHLFLIISFVINFCVQGF